MTPFEDELKKALARWEPSVDFTERVLANVKPKQVATWPIFAWRFASALAVMLLLVSGLAYRQHVRTVEGEAAKKQLLIAMHIAGAQLHQAQLRVKKIESPEVVLQ